MIHQQALKYSIKYKLQQQLTAQSLSSPANPITDLTSGNNFQSHNQIYMPEYHNYFLHTIEKEIKHQGNLLKRIRRKIDDFKEKQIEKKRIKNSQHYYSHLMFSSATARQAKSITKTANQTMTSTPTATLLTSATNTPRHTSKTKTNSFSNNFSRQSSQMRIKTACGSQEFSNIHLCKSFTPSRASFHHENQLIQRYGKLVKHTKKVNPCKDQGFSVKGGRPKWETFQSYGSNNIYLTKKMH